MSVMRQLYRLQQVDSRWDQRTQRLAEIKETLGETSDLLSAREAVAETRASLQELKRQVRALELEVASVAEKFKGNQERLYGGKVRNPKELTSLQEEAGALRRRRSELEDQELELMIEIEGQEAELAERQARLGQIEGNWRNDQSGMLAEKDRLEMEIAELEEERADLREPIRPADLAEYDDLRAAYGGIAVVLLRKGICQTCGVDVPTGVVNAVSRGEGRHYCPVCARLLYGG